jgi:hypothetical protein
MELNGGTITDTSGNNATLTFTVPNTSNVRVNYPSLGMDFVADTDGRYTLNGTAYNDLPSFLTATGGTFSRPSIGTYYDSTGTLQTASANTPRFDYDPVTLQPKGILIEESRSNLARYSDQMDNAIWVKGNMAIISNSGLSLDGTTNADLAVPNTSSTMHVINSSGITQVNGTVYTMSFYAKAAGITGLYSGISSVGAIITNLTNCSIVYTDPGPTYTVTSQGNGWCKIVQTYTSNGNLPYLIAYNGGLTFASDGVAGLYIWGFQIEQGSFPTSYIPTTTAAVTRAQDSLSMSTLGWFNNVEGQMFAEFIPNATFSFYPQIGLFGDGTSNNFIAYTLFPSNNLFFEWKEASSSLYFLNALAATENISTKFAGAYKTGSSAIVKNGGAPVSSSAALSALPINLFSIGSNIARGGSDGRYSGTISKIKYYPIRASNSQLQLLTQ